jgi:5-amino-6-(5-phosphoribosylamino)uracil reductase
MKIFSNTAISLDGRIGMKDFSKAHLGSQKDKNEMSRIRNLADAVVVGGNTFRNGPVPIFGQKHTKEKPMWNVIFTRTGDLPISEKLLNEQRVKILVFSWNKQPHLSSKNIEVIVINENSFCQAVVDYLSQRGIKNLLLESGGEVLFQFLAADLLDEMFVTVCPRIIGGKGAPSLVDGEGFSYEKTRNLRLLYSKQEESELFLHYEVLKNSKKPNL